MIYLTGATGLLGKEIRKYLDCIPVFRNDINLFLDEKPEDANIVIHCAAYTDVVNAEKYKQDCFKTNVNLTLDLINAFPNSKFIYISSEYANNPQNFYSWTKLWGEELVMKHSNYLIIRTNFLPIPFPYKEAFKDQYTQGDYVDIIAPMIVKEILKATNGRKYLGTGRKTMFELARRTVPDIKGISVDDIKSVKLPKDYV